MAITKDEVGGIAKSVAKIIREYVNAQSFASSERVVELIGRVNLLEVKNQELQRQCDANKRHVSNLESKISKSKPWPGE